MARKPFFGSGPAPQIARMDMQSATAPGRMYFNALTQFGQSLASGIEKFRANKEKKENQANMENMLIAQGIDAELAKPLSKDPQAFGNYMALEKFSQQKKYQDSSVEQAERQIDLEDRKVHSAEIDADIERTKREAREKVAKSFMESEGAEGKFGKSYVDLIRNHPAKDSPNFYSQVYDFGSRANPKGGVLDRFAESYEGNLIDVFSNDDKVRNKAFAGFLASNPTTDDIKGFLEISKLGQTRNNAVTVTDIEGYDAGVVTHGDGKSQVIYKGRGDTGSAFTTNIKAMSDFYNRAKTGDSEALRKFKLGLVQEMRMGKTDPDNPLTDEYSINPILMDMAVELGITKEELLGQ